MYTLDDRDQARYTYEKSYECHDECCGFHPHLVIREIRPGQFLVAGQSLKAGIHCSGLEFSFMVASREEAEKAIEDFQMRRL